MAPPTCGFVAGQVDGAVVSSVLMSRNRTKLELQQLLHWSPTHSPYVRLKSDCLGAYDGTGPSHAVVGGVRLAVCVRQDVLEVAGLVRRRDFALSNSLISQHSQYEMPNSCEKEQHARSYKQLVKAAADVDYNVRIVPSRHVLVQLTQYVNLRHGESNRLVWLVLQYAAIRVVHRVADPALDAYLVVAPSGLIAFEDAEELAFLQEDRAQYASGVLCLMTGFVVPTSCALTPRGVHMPKGSEVTHPLKHPFHDSVRDIRFAVIHVDGAPGAHLPSVLHRSKGDEVEHAHLPLPMLLCFMVSVDDRVFACPSSSGLRGTRKDEEELAHRVKFEHTVAPVRDGRRHVRGMVGRLQLNIGLQHLPHLHCGC